MTKEFFKELQREIIKQDPTIEVNFHLENELSLILRHSSMGKNEYIQYTNKTIEIMYHNQGSTPYLCDVAKDIIMMMNERIEKERFIENIDNIEEIKELIQTRITPLDIFTFESKDIYWQPFMDLAITSYVMFRDIKNDGFFIFPVTNKMIERINVKPTELMDIAMKNTVKATNILSRSLLDKLKEEWKDDKEMNQVLSFIKNIDVRLLKSINKIDSSSLIFAGEDEFIKLANLWNVEQVMICPSTYNELIVMPCLNFNYKTMEQFMLSLCKKLYKKDIILNPNGYIYNIKNHGLYAI